MSVKIALDSLAFIRTLPLYSFQRSHHKDLVQFYPIPAVLDIVDSVKAVASLGQPKAVSKACLRDLRTGPALCQPTATEIDIRVKLSFPLSPSSSPL